VVSINGGSSIAGWFISWKIPNLEMDDEMGYPHGLETSIYINSYVLKNCGRKHVMAISIGNTMMSIRCT
jgi:hypothetical protein